MSRLKLFKVASTGSIGTSPSRLARLAHGFLLVSSLFGLWVVLSLCFFAVLVPKDRALEGYMTNIFNIHHKLINLPTNVDYTRFPLDVVRLLTIEMRKWLWVSYNNRNSTHVIFLRTREDLVMTLFRSQFNLILKCGSFSDWSHVRKKIEKGLFSNEKSDCQHSYIKAKYPLEWQPI